MSTFYVSKPITDALLDSLRDDYPAYLKTIGTSAKMRLDVPKTIKLSDDYEAVGLERPVVLVSPVSSTAEDEAVGVVSVKILFEVVFVIDGLKEDDATTKAMLYADALVGMVTDDDYLGGAVTHASVPRTEYYPGGTQTARYALSDVEITLEVNRS